MARKRPIAMQQSYRNLRQGIDLAASARQVVGARMGMDPGRPVDVWESARMVPEKMIAFAGAAALCAHGAARMGSQLAEIGLREMRSAQREVSAAIAAPNMFALGLVMNRSAWAFWQRAAVQGAALGLSAMRVQHDSLIPVVRAADRNRRRLSKT